MAPKKTAKAPDSVTISNEPTALAAIHLNAGQNGLPKNPRFIKDDRFRALCDSIKADPEYMMARPIVVDDEGVILGGNMRYRACRELGIDPLPAGWVVQVTGWPLEKKKRFLLIDNNQYGEWDWEALANEWDVSELLAGGFSDEELADLALQTHQDVDADAEAEGKQPGDPRSTITFPPRVWLTQRAEIIAELSKIVASYGGGAEWAD